MSSADNKDTVRTLYIMLMVGIVLPVISLIAVIMAYLYRGDAGTVLQTHYQFLIRTFWISLLFQITGVLTWVFGIGWIIFAIWIFWILARCIKGFRIAGRDLPHPKPTGWLID